VERCGKDRISKARSRFGTAGFSVAAAADEPPVAYREGAAGARDAGDEVAAGMVVAADGREQIEQSIGSTIHFDSPARRAFGKRPVRAVQLPEA
jgi:hypothetical protein